MLVSTQLKILEVKNYYQYLKENSYWIKYLNRNHNSFYNFDTFIKDKYSLRISDKISKTIDSVDLVTNILKSLN